MVKNQNQKTKENKNPKLRIQEIKVKRVVNRERYGLRNQSQRNLILKLNHL